MDLRDRLGLALPVAQAGLGGGLATGELAGAVSAAGGLGTVGLLSTHRLAAELARARELAAGRPVAVNLLMPFLHRGHVAAALAGGVRAAVLFCGFDRRLVDELRAAGVFVLHQVGSGPEAERALADGADGLIAQGLEAGGHLRAVQPAAQFLPHVLALAGRRPELLAGGIATGADVRTALAAGAAGVVCGTRFLLTPECRAHPRYLERVLAADRTLETTLFGFGWPERHRVVPNAATDRWCRPDGRPRPAARLANAVGSPVGRLLAAALPVSAGEPLARAQRAGFPMFSPTPPLAGMPDRVVDSGPLYAGECARRIDRVTPAADVVAELASGC